ncbi:LPD3 domain-containing protein [Paraburkholderia graminis]|uniref:LPD3 domain-containing protein n=1 Tax=Paraburkholderia graminis TaxID=60548 RepID=UPI0038BB224E
MQKSLHIYLHVRDSSWEEQKHPRKQNGQFGTGGSGSSAGAVSLKGDELGDYTSMKELRQKALEHADRFIGKSFSNKATGNEIEVTRKGVKHTLAGASDTLVRTVPAIPSLLESAHLLATSPDKRGDVNVLAVETYIARIEIDGEQHSAILTVKKYSDGRRYYDHGIVK